MTFKFEATECHMTHLKRLYVQIDGVEYKTDYLHDDDAAELAAKLRECAEGLDPQSAAILQAATRGAPNDAIRPTREQAEKAIAEFLKGEFDDVPDFTLIEDGDEDSGDKCGWVFWVHLDDTTSYVHRDLKIEWYGTNYIAASVPKGDGND